MNYSYLYLIVPAFFFAGCQTLNSNSDFSSSTNPTGKANYSQAYQDYVALGAQYVQKGRYDLAEPKLKRAIEIDSRPPEAWNILAVMYEQKRDIQEGYQVYEKLTASHPNYLLGFTNFATFLCKFDRDKELSALLKRMRAKNKEFQAVSYISEGNCALKRGQSGKAQTAYKQALVYDPQAAGALLPLAEISLNQNDYRAALGYLKVVHTYVGYSPESVSLGIKAARGAKDSLAEQEFIRIMRANYSNSTQAKALGI